MEPTNYPKYSHERFNRGSSNDLEDSFFNISTHSKDMPGAITNKHVLNVNNTNNPSVGSTLTEKLKALKIEQKLIPQIIQEHQQNGHNYAKVDYKELLHFMEDLNKDKPQTDQETKHKLAHWIHALMYPRPYWNAW